MKEIININSIAKTYRSGLLNKKINAIDSVSFSINENEIFGYLGPNGAGKTTTIKIIMGLIKPDKGNVSILGSNINDLKIRKKIGYLPENPSFYPFLTAYEILHLMCSLYGIKEKDDRIKTLLGLVGLADSMNRKAGTFSKGMTQRLGIAQTLLNDPEIIILDEPLSGLDPIGRKELKDIILMMKRRGKTIVFSSHILPDIEMIADRVCVINRGKIIGIGNINEIIKREIKEIDIEISMKDFSELENLKNEFIFFAIRDNEAYITVNNEKILNKIKEIVKNKKGEIISLIPREGKLEDYFMNLINKGGNE